MLNKSAKPIVAKEIIVFLMLIPLCINILVADVFPPDAPVEIEVNVSNDKIYVGDSLDVYATITLLKDHSNYVEGKKYRIQKRTTYAMIDFNGKLIPLKTEKIPLWEVLYSDNDKILDEKNQHFTFHYKLKLSNLPPQKNIYTSVHVFGYPALNEFDYIARRIEIECLEEGLEYKDVSFPEDYKDMGEGVYDFSNSEPLKVDLKPQFSRLKNVKEINPDLFKIVPEKVENNNSTNSSDNDSTRSEDTSGWHYKTYIENNTEMTTVFIKYDDKTEKEVVQFLAKEKVKLITEEERCISVIAPLTTVSKFKKTLDGKIEICGLRDTDTYIKEGREEEVVYNDSDENKSCLVKGYTHVDKIFIVQVEKRIENTKKNTFMYESLLADSNGVFSVYLPENNSIGISVYNLNEYMEHENRVKIKKKDRFKPKLIKLDTEQLPYQAVIKIPKGDPFDYRRYVKGKNSIREIKIPQDSIVMINIPMYNFRRPDIGISGGVIGYLRMKAKMDSVNRHNYPYLNEFLQKIPLSVYEKIESSSYKKIMISGNVKYNNNHFPDEISFLSAKHQLTFMEVDSLGNFSGELYPDVYAVSVIKPKEIKTDVKTIIVCDTKKNHFELDFDLLDQSIHYNSIYMKYNYFSENYIDIYHSRLLIPNEK